MKSSIRFLLGIISTGLLAAGFARAAQHLDPMNLALPGVAASTSGSTPSCGSECFLTLNER